MKTTLEKDIQTGQFLQKPSQLQVVMQTAEQMDVIIAEAEFNLANYHEQNSLTDRV